MGPARRIVRPSALALLAAAAGILAGCVERVLVVESRPSGARFTLNGVERGVTPQRIPYVHDGRFRVRLELEGYESLADEIVTRTGTDALPGIDFFAENVWPGQIRRVTTRHYDLVPLKTASYTEAELAAMLRHAEGFRARAAREAEEPGTPRPARTHGAPPPPAPPAPPAPRPAAAPVPAGR